MSAHLKRVKHRGKARWIVNVYHPNGTRERHMLPPAASKDEGIAERDKWIKKLAEGIKPGCGGILFADYAKERLQVYCERVSSITTITGYRADVRKLLNPQLPLVTAKMRDLNHRMVEQVCVRLPKLYPDLGNWSKRKALQRFRAILVDAADDGLIQPRLPRKVTLPSKTSKRERQTLTSAEIRDILATARKYDEIMYVAISLALLTGFRRGEILGLRWSSIDWERGIVTAKWNWTKGEMKVSRKSGDTHRVSIHSGMLDILRDHRRNMGSPVGDVLVFDRSGATPKGVPINEDIICRRFKYLVALAGIPRNVVFHELRHSAASMALHDTSGGLSYAQRLLGHKDLSTTADIYAHHLGDERQQAAELEAAVLGN